MEFDINASVEEVLSQFRVSGNELEALAVQELKTQAKQALLQLVLETRETLQAVERWAGVQRALLPEALRHQALHEFCRENPTWQSFELRSDNPE